MKRNQFLALVLTVLLVLSLFTACNGQRPAEDMAMDGNYYNKSESMEVGVESDSLSGGSGSTNTLPESMKWIRTVYMDAETKAMDELLVNIQNRVNELGGYIEGRSVYNGSPDSTWRARNASLVIRIPVDRADEFIRGVEEQANVTSSEEELENITLTYVATESRVKALQTEEARLLELMEQAQNLSELLEIEDRLTDVRAELETVTSQLRRYDNLVDYATVHLNIDEVQILTPVAEEGFFQRIASGFVESLNDLWHFLKEFVVWLLVNLPYLVLHAAIAVGLFFLIRRIVRKKTSKKSKTRPPFPTEEAKDE